MWFWQPDLGEATQRFDDQATAEAWLAAHYEDLLDEGIGAVTLYEGDREIYGPMPLDPV